MPEANGDRDTRMDRIERALELLIADHEQFRADHKQLLIAQVLQKDAIDQLLKLTQEHSQQIQQHSQQIPALDARVDRLVSSIGEFISRLPPR
jgi:hypothetical protein